MQTGMRQYNRPVSSEDIAQMQDLAEGEAPVPLGVEKSVRGSL